jgi:hypothetical protein
MDTRIGTTPGCLCKPQCCTDSCPRRIRQYLFKKEHISFTIHATSFKNTTMKSVLRIFPLWRVLGATGTKKKYACKRAAEVMITKK